MSSSLRKHAPLFAARCVALLLCASAASNVRAQATGDGTVPELPSYGAQARVVAEAGKATVVPQAQTQRLQEEMGPGFSLAESLPGVVPVFSGVPFLLVRGAPPAGTRSYYDGIALPSLFHMALGPSVVDSHLLGDMRFYPSVAPARFSGHTGGVLSISGPELDRARKPFRELELSLLDASGYLQTPASGGTLAIGWRYGNPGLLMSAIGLDATLSYFDYSLRYEEQLTPDDRLLVLGIGGGDQLGSRSAPQDDIGLDFHRLALRLTRTLPKLELSSQLVLGYDASTLGQALSGNAARVMPSLYATFRDGPNRLRVGTDLGAAVVGLRRGPHVNALSALSSGVSSGAPDFTLTPQDFLDHAALRALPTRTNLGTYVELHVAPSQKVDFDLGLHANLWLAGSEAAASLDPSGLATYHASRMLDLHAGLALAHRPQGSPFPLPGLDDVALALGLEAAAQSEAGLTLQLGDDTRMAATGFYNHFFDLVYMELILDCKGNTNPQAAQARFPGTTGVPSVCDAATLPTANGDAYGAELYFQRNFLRRLSGLVSYTLSFATATARDGTHFTPSSDQRHTANAVLHYDLGGGFSTGIRIHYGSGKMAVNAIFDTASWSIHREEHRLPGFFRADLHTSYSFRTALGRMQATLSWLNLTFSREATKRDCFFDPTLAIECRVAYQPAIVLPNLALRAEM